MIRNRMSCSIAILSLFVLLNLSLVSSAQQTTPNPIFVPLAKSSPTPDTTSPVVTSTPSLDDTEIVYASTATPAVEVEKREHHVLRRPIAIQDDKVHWADRTYPYGSTQWGTHQVHTGVDFVNQRYTPVFAAQAGEVVFSGKDDETVLGPYANYYGNVVVLAHEINTLDGLQVFTLYGHLDRTEVTEGDHVDVGQRIGRVGSSGIAQGPHLHFEVRAGNPFDFYATRNPELWLQYYVDHGTIAGFVHDAKGNPLYEKRLVVRSATVNREVFTYASERVNMDPVWHENFVVGDLPAGDYEIVILNAQGAVFYKQTFTVTAYKTTFVDILDDEN